MKREISKVEAQNKIDSFFQSKFNSDDLRKIKRLAMKYKIKLANYRKLFCKKCFSKLNGRLLITKTAKTIVCASCGFKNKYSIK